MDTLGAALERARVARLHLLDVMEAALPTERGNQVRPSFGLACFNDQQEQCEYSKAVPKSSHCVASCVGLPTAF